MIYHGKKMHHSFSLRLMAELDHTEVLHHLIAYLIKHLMEHLMGHATERKTEQVIYIAKKYPVFPSHHLVLSFS